MWPCVASTSAREFHSTTSCHRIPPHDQAREGAEVTHQHPLPMTPADAIESALILAILSHTTARTPLQRRKAMERVDELKREKALAERRAG